MSLAEAVSMIADQMEQDDAPGVSRYLLQLRIAIKACAGNNGPPSSSAPDPFAAMQAAARKEFSGRARQEETAGEMTVGLIGGPVGSEDVPTFVQVAAGMPFGAKTLVAGSVYVLGEDRNLHYSEDETRKMRKPGIVVGKA